MSLDIIHQHASTLPGGLQITFTVGRIVKDEPNSPETANEILGGVAGACSGIKCGENRTGTESATSGDGVERHATEIHERPSINDEASPGAGPQAEASLAGTGTGTLAGREGRSAGEAASADLPTIPKPPAFVAKARKPLRPLCLNPSECAGYGTHTCHRCLKAAGQTEAAA